jgi:hypothetical protein
MGFVVQTSEKVKMLQLKISSSRPESNNKAGIHNQRKEPTFVQTTASACAQKTASRCE